MSQGVTGDVKRQLKVGLKQYFFKVVFHGADGQAVAFFGDKKGVCKPAVKEQFPDGYVVS